MNRLKNFIYVLRHLTALLSTNPSVRLIDPLERDLRDLAAGRWYSYKQINSPNFVIGMTKDEEAMLYQYSFVKIGKKVTGAKLLEQTAVMISVCEACRVNKESITAYLNRI